MKNIPNAITLTNLFLGCVAIAFIFNNEPTTGAVLIIICAILDFLDGAVASLLKAYSETGKQLDSLADLVSFGLAPAAIIFHYLNNAFYTINPENTNFVWAYAAFIIVVFSALRLARFNIETENKTCFTGLPTPASALFIVSIPLTIALAKPESVIVNVLELLTGQIWFNMAVTISLSALMVSPFKMFSLKIKNFSWKNNRIRYIFLAICIILLITFGLAAIPLFMIFYILLSLIWPAKKMC
jgi:CDP-diacylglycerol---serine O-phosphatidyltransferase